MIIIISSFQEDNIFWHECQSNIWSSITKVEMTLVMNMHKLFTVCTEQVRSPYTGESVGFNYYNSKVFDLRFYDAVSNISVMSTLPE